MALYFSVPFIKALTVLEWVDFFQNNYYGLCSSFSNGFIRPKVSFLTEHLIFHDFVSASSNEVDRIIYGSNPTRVLNVCYMDEVTQFP